MLFISNLGGSQLLLMIRDARAIEGNSPSVTIRSPRPSSKTRPSCFPPKPKEHRFRNVDCLGKYLGSKEVGEGPELKVVPVQVGDTFVLCSDGLSGPCTDQQILDFVRDHPDVQGCADGLAQLALDNGSRDNVSAIVVEVVEGK